MGGIHPNLDLSTTNPIRWNGRTSTKEEENEAVHGEEQDAECAAGKNNLSF